MARAFDRRLGADFLDTVPRSPGVYRVLDTDARVIYVGKAANLHRRLSQYRNASRRKAHRKMREIVKGAASIAFDTCETAHAAAIREAQLIEALRPRWNVAGAFSFLYPFVGLGQSAAGHAVLAFSTAPAERPDLAWHGAFRSRDVSGTAFFALIRLLGLVGHRERMARRPRGTRTWACEIRRLPAGFAEGWTPFFRGESSAPLSALVLDLVDRPAARRAGATVQRDVDAVAAFFRYEARRLRQACDRVGETQWPVAQSERDVLLARARSR